jgi:uncharacterized protein (DUF983 family)
MPPKHRQLHALCPTASGNVFQALVDPPYDGNNLSFDGGDERTAGSDDNTIVIVVVIIVYSLITCNLKVMVMLQIKYKKRA